MTTNPNTFAAAPDPRTVAREYVLAAQVALSDVRVQLEGIRILFGRSVHASLADVVDRFEDRAFDAIRSLEFAQARSDERRAEIRRIIADREALLEQAIYAETARSKRSGRPLAEWCVKAIEDIGEAPF